MERKAKPPFIRRITSEPAIWFYSIAAGLAVFALAIFLQWLIYDDWMHRSGPLRIVGSALAAILACVVAHRWQLAIRLRKIEMLHRFETIKWMNDRIRNALQAIECLTYAADPTATDSVKGAVDVIEGVLNEVLVNAHPAPVRGSRQERKSGARFSEINLGQTQTLRDELSNSDNVR
jgi:hypothetical protein